NRHCDSRLQRPRQPRRPRPGHQRIPPRPRRLRRHLSPRGDRGHRHAPRHNQNRITTPSPGSPTRARPSPQSHVRTPRRCRPRRGSETTNQVQAFLPALTQSRGTIVNNLSLNALAPLPLIPAYSISKAAAFSLTQSLRALVADRGVTVHAVLTGPVDT